MTRKRMQGLILLCIFSLMSFSITAQPSANRALAPGSLITGTIDAENPAQVYTFTATAGDAATITLTPESGFALTLLVTDAAGNPLAYTAGTGAEAEIVLSDLSLTAAGTYYITVFPVSGNGTTAGTFNLLLDLAGSAETTTEVEATEEPTPEVEVTDAVTPTTTTQPAEFVPNQQVILPNGISVTLTWQTRDDLNLQVRDPIGGTLFWDSRTTTQGGTFGPDINGICEVLTEPPAVETATWPGGPLAAGSYEILVFYRQSCDGTAAVDFTVDVVVDGQALPTIESTLLAPINNEANVFLTSFTVSQDGTASLGESGPYLDTLVLDVSAQDLLGLTATPIVQDQAVQGVITNQQPYQTFAFEGLAGQIVNVTMNALNGSLDPLVLVLDSGGNVIAGNDDAQAVVNINSQISGLRLPTEDVYTIVATRYGKSVAGTQGNFELLVSGSQIPPELLELDLPSGDIEITLRWEAPVDLQLLVRDPSGNAVYDDTPTIPSGGRLTEQGNINCNIVEGIPVSYIYWPDNFLRIGSYEIEVWYQSDCGTPGPVTFTIYIVVEDEPVFIETATINFNERYLTSFNIDQATLQAIPSIGGIIGGSETLPYQTELASALRIAPDQNVPGSITADDKFDLYTFEGQAGDLVTISMTATSATLDTLLFLIDPNGVEIASNDDSNETTNSLISNLLLTQDGEYTVIATHYGALFGGTTGGYNLNLRIDR
ncbi:MAG: hypothetical protein OHK0046_26790 [Anaerolineae bacterium]